MIDLNVRRHHRGTSGCPALAAGVGFGGLIPPVSIPLIERPNRVGNYAEEQTGWIPHYPPRMHALHALSAKMLEPGDLSGQVIGMDIQMHPRGSLAEALHEQPEVLAV